MADKNTSYILKRRVPRERQEFTRKYNQSDTPLYSVDKIYKLDWKFFMWLSSLEKVEDYVCLFIVTWDSVPLNDVEFKELPKESTDSDMDVQNGSIKFATLIREFKEETNRMIQIIEYLKSSCTKVLDDYKNYRFNNNQDLRRILVNNAWAEFEENGLDKYSHATELQIKRCTFAQKREIRSMISSRMNSFRSLVGQTKTSNPKDDMKSFKKENDDLKNKIANLVKENDDLKNKTTNLVKENSRKQTIFDNIKNQIDILIEEENSQKEALNNSKNVSWNDNDPSYIKNLISDIVDLQDSLSDFTIVQGSDYKIIDENAEKLLKTYNCRVDYSDFKAKFVLGNILQRFVMTTILDDFRRYLQYARSSGDVDPILESDIVNATETLIRYTELFGENRKGDDDITKTVPKTIRKHVYSALSCRGLSDEHPLVKETADKLLKEMNKYRKVLDEEINSELNDHAIQITYNVINIFCFRLKAYTSKLTYQFFEAGEDIDSRFMQGAFGDIKKSEVEACSFPCIGMFDGDKSNQRAFIKAQIVSRPKKVN